MTDSPGERLFGALREALSRRPPRLDHVRVRRAVLEAAAKRTSAERRTRGLRFALAGVGLAAALGVTISLLGPDATTFRVAEHSGRVGEVLEAAPSRPLAVTFSEGTQVSLRAGSRGRVSRLDAHGARVELERGTVAADVAHRPGSDWTFSAGPFEVHVLGTQLEVAWDPKTEQFELKVARGAVRVRGPVIHGGQDVRDGQICRVDLKRQVMELGVTELRKAAPTGDRNAAAEPGAIALPSASAPADVAGSALPMPVASTGGAVEPPKPSWLLLAQVGKPREALAAAERAGLGVIYSSASAESLLELARAARLAGRPDIERAALLACRKRAPGQAAAAQAAYLLGRASGPREAAAWFAAYLQDQPKGLLAREASGRLLESHVAAKNQAGAERAASQYLAAYPSGPHATMARQVLGGGDGDK